MHYDRGERIKTLFVKKKIINTLLWSKHNHNSYPSTSENNLAQLSFSCMLMSLEVKIILILSLPHPTTNAMYTIKITYTLHDSLNGQAIKTFLSRVGGRSSDNGQAILEKLVLLRPEIHSYTGFKGTCAVEQAVLCIWPVHEAQRALLSTGSSLELGSLHTQGALFWEST